MFDFLEFSTFIDTYFGHLTIFEQFSTLGPTYSDIKIEPKRSRLDRVAR
jgi:hypothetical protein